MKRVENWFLIIFIPLSLLMMIVMPIFRPPDEPAHLERAFLIADGQMISSIRTGKATIPENFYGASLADNISYKDLINLWEDMTDRHYEINNMTATAIYPPVSYFPQALGMKLAMIFSSNRLVVFYAARLMNWLCATAVLWWGIWKIPKGKWIFLFLSILPVNLQEVSSASADGMATAIVFALTAFVCWAVMEKPVFRKKEYVVMTLLSLGLVCWKLLYSPMVLLYLMIPKECFRTKNCRTISLMATMLGTLVLIGTWGLICYVNLFHGASEGLEGSTVSMIANFLQRPWDYFVRLGMDLRYRVFNHVAGVFGTRLSWSNIIPGNAFWGSSFALCLILWVISDAPEMKWKPRMIMLGVSILSVMVIYFLLYLWWTPIDSPKIEGFQGRYLLPLTLPVMLAVKPPQWKKEKLLPYLMGATVLVDIGFLIRIVQHIAV